MNIKNQCGAKFRECFTGLGKWLLTINQPQIAYGNLTPTALDPATPRETAAPSANNLSNQHAPQAKTPGK